MSFFSFSFLLFSSRFCWVVSNKRKRESARVQIFFSSFEHNKKKKKYVFCLRSKSRADVRYKNRSSKQTTNALCVSSSWAFSSLHLKPLRHFYSRARNIFYYGFLFFLLSLVLMSDSTLFFFFLLAKTTEEVSRVLVFPEKREEEEEEFFSKMFSLFSFFSLFYSLFSLRAREHLSSNLLPSYFNNAP